MITTLGRFWGKGRLKKGDVHIGVNKGMKIDRRTRGGISLWAEKKS